MDFLFLFNFIIYKLDEIFNLLCCLGSVTEMLIFFEMLISTAFSQ